MHGPPASSVGPTAYDFVVPPTILFGPGRLAEVGAVAARLGRRAWVVTGSGGVAGDVGATLAAALAAAGLEPCPVATSAGEPTVEQVAAALRGLPARSEREQPVVVAVGGGATIDFAKALAALATNADPAGDATQEVIDRLEGVGRGLAIDRPPLPLVAVPTTAGTGAEATRNAVLSCPRRRFKKSMRSPLMVPRVALVDPLLTRSCPRHVTAAAGLDCVTQLVESFVCRFRAPLPRALALEALPRAVAALPRVLGDPDDLAARGDMSHAALVSGICLTNAGLGLAHGVAAALGVECGTPHGAACALLLPVALRVNLPAVADDLALLERAVDPGATAPAPVAARAFVDRVEALCTLAGTPRRLADVGLERGRIGWLAEHSTGPSMRGNPVTLSTADLHRVLEEAF